MRNTTVFAFIVLLLVSGIFTSVARGSSSGPISPGLTEGYETIGQDCPTFSWSAASDAAAFRLEVYEVAAGEAVSRDQIRQTALPVVTKEIPATAFAWTAPLGQCLVRGVSYIWYIQGLNAHGEGEWSEGKVFAVEPQALTLEQEEAVREVVRGYLEADSLSDAENTDISRAQKSEIKTASDISLPQSTEGTTNTLLGTGAGAALSSPSTGTENNTFIGLNAGASDTIGKYNTFVGSGAGYSTVGSGSGPLSNGHSNSFFGMNAGYYNLTGSFNSFFGYASGYKNTSSFNSFFGYQSGHENTSGSYNSFFGRYAGYNNTTGSYNSFFGSSAGYHSVDGSNNSIFGYQAGYNKFTGSENSFFGARAGYNSVAGSGNVFLGFKAGYNEGNSNRLYIANSDTASPLIYGEFDNGVVKINGELVIASDERLKENIKPLESTTDKVMQLEGVSYEMKSSKSEDRGLESEREIGLLAQNVETVFPELVHTDGRGYKAVAYDKMAAVLIEAIKEQQLGMKEKAAGLETDLRRKEAGFEDSLREKDARLEALIKEKEARIEELTLIIEDMSAHLAEIEKPVQAFAARED